MQGIVRNERDFVNCRARLQRLSDSKFFTGWVESLESQEMILRTDKTVQLHIAEEFSLEIYGDKVRCDCFAVMEGLAKEVKPVYFDSQDLRQEDEVACERYKLEITSEYRFFETKEGRRKLVQKFEGMLLINDNEYETEVCDISYGGLGCFFYDRLEIGSTVGFRKKIDGRNLDLEGEVRYCRKDRTTGWFRIGLQWGEMMRTDAGSWNRLVDEA
jgi:hypothetical protein